MVNQPLTLPVAIAADHAAIELKALLKGEMEAWGHAVHDLGPHDTTSVDYPDFAHALAHILLEGRASRGVLLCGSGIGMSIAANRHPGIRAALCHSGLEARLTRAHNDANVLCLGARIIGSETAKDCLRAFLDTPFEGGRHAGRVAKIESL